MEGNCLKYLIIGARMLDSTFLHFIRNCLWGKLCD